MKKDMIIRRKEMLEYHKQGMKTSEWIPLVASKHNCSEDALKKDWGRRRSWIHQFMKIDDSKQLANEMI